MKSPRLVLALALFAVGLAIFPGIACADDDDDADDRDKAHELVERGEIHSLQQVLKALAVEVAGELVDVRLKPNGKGWVYACQLVTPDGRRMVIDVDAVTLAIVGSERRP